jgi:hypothetical protein
MRQDTEGRTFPNAIRGPNVRLVGYEKRNRRKEGHEIDAQRHAPNEYSAADR